MLEVRRLDAVQFVCAVGSGKTDPVIVTGENEQGDTTEVVLKVAGMCDRKQNGLAAEVIAACLASQLGLPIPEAFVVTLSPEWKSALPTDFRGRYRDEFSAFGSKFIRPQWPTWCSTNRLTEPMIDMAARVFAFDLFIDNHDRSETNANCLVRGNQIRIIDHELAWTPLLFAPKHPWLLGAFQSYTQPGNHIFRRELSAEMIDRASIKAAWCSLHDDDIEAYGAAVPDEWRDQEFISGILSKIRDVRDNIDGCLDEFERILT